MKRKRKKFNGTSTAEIFIDSFSEINFMNVLIKSGVPVTILNTFVIYQL